MDCLAFVSCLAGEVLTAASVPPCPVHTHHESDVIHRLLELVTTLALVNASARRRDGERILRLRAEHELLALEHGAMVLTGEMDHDLHGPHHVVAVQWAGGVNGVRAGDPPQHAQVPPATHP